MPEEALQEAVVDAIFLSRDKVSAIFPQAVSGGLASTTILYSIFASIAVISILAVRERVDCDTFWRRQPDSVRKFGTKFRNSFQKSYQKSAATGLPSAR